MFSRLISALFAASFRRNSLLFIIAIQCFCADSHPPTRRLYEDLLTGYNQLIRPVQNYSEKVIVKLSLKLTQLLEMNMKRQVLSTNVWVEQKWHDFKLTWDPQNYGGVDMINVPGDDIWQPDIVLFNNENGEYEPTSLTKALIKSNGEVIWNPPALYKSTCEIDVEWFPFDVQTCILKFGSWTYDGHEVDLRHINQSQGSLRVENGIDMSEFYTNVEWDIMKVPASYDNEFEDSGPEPYPRITFNITMRRKTLFYTVNLIIPCVGISFLTLLVFYLPSDSGEKLTLASSILVSLTVFFLLLSEIIPASSLAVPLIGKYLLFTMLLITLCICATVGVLDIHFRSPSTHVMSPWVRTVFIDYLPRILCMKRVSSHDLAQDLAAISGTTRVIHTCRRRLKKDEPSSSHSHGKCLVHPHHRVHSSIARENYSVTSVSAPRGELFPEMPLDYAQNSNWQRIKEDGGEFTMDHQLLPHHDYRRSDHNPYIGLPPPPPPPIELTGGESGSVQYNYPFISAFGQENSEEVEKAIESILYIADHLKKQDEEHDIIEDWKYVAMVLDRLFLWIFSITCVIGTCIILLRAPSLYDKSIPLSA